MAHLSRACGGCLRLVWLEKVRKNHMFGQSQPLTIPGQLFDFIRHWSQSTPEPSLSHNQSRNSFLSSFGSVSEHLRDLRFVPKLSENLRTSCSIFSFKCRIALFLLRSGPWGPTSDDTHYGVQIRPFGVRIRSVVRCICVRSLQNPFGFSYLSPLIMTMRFGR